ncbi:VOC family protein [Halostreptopolyspora alba]|uniref:VOC family protein n=1 Tax=Halostreptopolyspora alba TaxID=2487137 RepID=A0A3N0E671_9ACTN|nr:VOC family protein [Nocardiopsaceae bacterium YIM 96095]
MLTTDFVLGSPCWLDLGAPDIEATSTFYTTVFDWEFSPVGPDAEYGMFTKDGDVVAAVGRLTEEGARSAWMIYFHAPDAQAVAEQVSRAGGAVRVDAFDVDGQGRMAQFTDPQGGQFAVWEPGKTAGLGVVNEPGSLSWVELMTTDVAAAKAFYGQIFGWRTSETELPGGGGAYSMIIPSGQSEDRMQGGIMGLPAEYLPDGSPYWHPVFDVADCDATVARVTGNGGNLKMGPEDAEGVGRLAVCEDPAGAEFVALTPVSS